MSVSLVVVVSPRGPLSRFACALGLHARLDDPTAGFAWCPRCGAAAMPGWRWVGSTHDTKFSLLAYERGETAP